MNNLKSKEPLLALMLSAFLPGLGQIYSGRLKRGISFLTFIIIFNIAFLFYILNPVTRITIFVLVILVCYALFDIFIIVDAYRCARIHNINNNIVRNMTISRRIFFAVAILFFIFVFNAHRISGFYIRRNIIQLFRISVEAMRPTLLKGDRVLINKVIYKKSRPMRNDIIAFKYPKNTKRVSIRRVVGLPGETIEIKNGSFLINNLSIQKPSEVANIYYYNKGEYGKEGNVLKIPSDSYYVLGDNSILSEDSRDWGFIPKEYLLGKVVKVFFPYNWFSFQNLQKPGEEEYVKGTKYWIEGKDDEAITEFTKAIQANSDYADAYYYRGLIYHTKGNHSQAVSDYSKAIEINPNNSEYYYGRGLVYDDKNDSDKAISDFTKSIQINPKDAAAYNNRGLAYAGKGNFKQAVLDHSKAIKINPNYADAYFSRALIYALEGNHDLIILDCNKAIEIKPNYAQAYLCRGFAYASKGNFDKAIIDYNKAIEIDPDDTEPYIKRAIAYFHKQEYAKSWNDVYKIEALDGEVDPEFLEDLKKASGREK